MNVTVTQQKWVTNPRRGGKDGRLQRLSRRGNVPFLGRENPRQKERKQKEQRFPDVYQWRCLPIQRTTDESQAFHVPLCTCLPQTNVLESSVPHSWLQICMCSYISFDFKYYNKVHVTESFYIKIFFLKL